MRPDEAALPAKFRGVLRPLYQARIPFGLFSASRAIVLDRPDIVGTGDVAQCLPGCSAGSSWGFVSYERCCGMRPTRTVWVFVCPGPVAAPRDHLGEGRDRWISGPVSRAEAQQRRASRGGTLSRSGGKVSAPGEKL